MIDRATTAERRALGGGFHLFREPPGAPHPWRLEAGFAPPGWTARRQVRPSDPVFPGTALSLEDVWLEIVAIETFGAGRQRFFLAPWEERFPLRTVVALDTATCRRLAEEHRLREQRAHVASLLTPLAPLLGLLPAADQNALESRYGLPAVRNTLLSAFATLFVAFVGSALAITWLMRVPMAGLQPLAEAAAKTAPVWFYLLPEALARLYSAGHLNEPLGTLLLALPARLARGCAAAFRGSPRAATQPHAAAGDELLEAQDVVRVLPGGGLEILSQLPKEHWTLNLIGIVYRGELFAFVERGVVGTGAAQRHRFELRRAAPDQVFSSYQSYEPDEVREIYREQRRRQAATWVETFALLWGLLDDPTQQRLAETYRYHPWRMTRWALVLTAVVGGSLVAGGAARLETTAPGALIELAAGLALCAETLARWGALRTTGEAPASWLGHLLHPFALRALRWAPD